MHGLTDDGAPDYFGMLIAGRYRVERLLGEGGMGSVWAGRHVTLNRLVAIKFVHPRLANSEDALRRFDNEAKAASRIKSRHAVAVYDHGVTERGEPYIVMEYLEGESLEASMRRRGRLSLAEVGAVVTQAASALSAAHEQGIIHRDLKPDNIFLSRERDAGELGYVVKLVDFGIAKLVQEGPFVSASTTQAGTVLGTPHYMSPEALTASAPVAKAADIWSLGACAFAAACGRLPFEGSCIGDVVLKVCVEPLPVPSKLVPELPKAFDEWFLNACSRDLSRRFASAADAARALGQLEEWSQRRREGSAYGLRAARTLEDGTSDEPATSRRGLLLAGVLAGASSMLAVLGFYVMQRTRLAGQEVAAAAASARAIVEAENERRLRQVEQQSRTRLARAALTPTESAAGRALQKRVKARRSLPNSPSGGRGVE